MQFRNSMSLTFLDGLGQIWHSLPTCNFNKIALFIIYLVDFKVTQANSIQDVNLMSLFHLEGVELISEYHMGVPLLPFVISLSKSLWKTSARPARNRDKTYKTWPWCKFLLGFIFHMVCFWINYLMVIRWISSILSTSFCLKNSFSLFSHSWEPNRLNLNLFPLAYSCLVSQQFCATGVSKRVIWKWILPY